MRIFLVPATLALMAFPAIAQETRSMDVLGDISAEVAGEQRDWLTIESGVDGMDGASAVWSPHAPALPAGTVEGMSEHRRAAFERVTALMGDDNPLAGGEGLVDLRIVGFDPKAKNILREGMLSIEVRRFASEDMEAALAKRHEADVSFFRNRGPDTGLYVSAHKVGSAAQVDFDAVELGDEANAQGSFSATLCPISVLMGRGEVDASQCVPIAGEFDTALKQEAASEGAP